jgi:hypothetical protein
MRLTVKIPPNPPLQRGAGGISCVGVNSQCSWPLRRLRHGAPPICVSRGLPAPGCLAEGGWPQGFQGGHKILDFVGELRPFRGGDPLHPQALRFDAAEGQELLQKPYPLVRRVITIQVMAVTEVSAADENAVHALLEGAQQVVRGHAGRAHHPHHAHVARVLQTTDPSQVSSSVRSPGAQKTNDLGLKFRGHHA